MRKTLLIIIFATLLISCGGQKGDDPTPATDPSAAVLLSPAQNSLCTTGAIVSATQSAILFNWNAAANATSYDLTFTNLLTAVSTTQNFISNQAYLTLQRNTPYSWYITSKSASSSATARSETWKFYNAGEGAVSYAPFPAAITSPTYAQTVTTTAGAITLSWTGSSVTPGETLHYDIYLGTTTSPPVLKSNATDGFLNNVQVISKTTYYWKVVTKDAAGNTSESGLYQFSVN